MSPELGLQSYDCPHCGAFAQQEWATVHLSRTGVTAISLFDEERNGKATFAALPDRVKSTWTLTAVGGTTFKVAQLKSARCSACGGNTLWLGGSMLFPAMTSAPPPSPDLEGGALADYEEAARVLPTSPRAAAALLRLSLEKLCGQLLGKSAKIDSMIADFVALGVPIQVQRAMDVLRITGNEAVHPGTMDNIDDENTALSLFGLINLIVDVLITQPKHVDQLYAGLPESKRQAIEQRNAKAVPNPARNRDQEN